MGKVRILLGALAHATKQANMHTPVINSGVMSKAPTLVGVFECVHYTQNKQNRKNRSSRKFPVILWSIWFGLRITVHVMQRISNLAGVFGCPETHVSLRIFSGAGIVMSTACTLVGVLTGVHYTQNRQNKGPGKSDGGSSIVGSRHASGRFLMKTARPAPFYVEMRLKLPHRQPVMRENSAMVSVAFSFKKYHIIGGRFHFFFYLVKTLKYIGIRFVYFWSME